MLSAIIITIIDVLITGAVGLVMWGLAKFGVADELFTLAGMAFMWILGVGFVFCIQWVKEEYSDRADRKKFNSVMKGE